PALVRQRARARQPDRGHLHRQARQDLPHARRQVCHLGHARARDRRDPDHVARASAAARQSCVTVSVKSAAPDAALMRIVYVPVTVGWNWTASGSSVFEVACATAVGEPGAIRNRFRSADPAGHDTLAWMGAARSLTVNVNFCDTVPATSTWP